MNPLPLRSTDNSSEPADVPTITPYLPEVPDGSAVVIFPGGGYSHLADHEGEPVARWLNTLGVTAFVVKYRLGPRHRHPAMLEDARRAVRMVRSGATGAGIDARRVGVLGFSAGGHLASTVSTQFDAGSPDANEEVERVSSRPDVSILLYAVISLVSPFAHVGSRNNLLGPDAPASLVEQMSSETRVTAQTPPTFLFHTADDPGVPVENALLYAMALRKHKVPFELHAFEQGRHGVGLATDDPILNAWTRLCATWLKKHGFGHG